MEKTNDAADARIRIAEARKHLTDALEAISGPDPDWARCSDCKHGISVPSTMFCDMLYEKPDWGLPEQRGNRAMRAVGGRTDDFCAWGERRRES